MSHRAPVCVVAGFSALIATAITIQPLFAAPGVEKKAPDFSLRDRDGTLVRLSDFAYSGKPRPRRSKQVVVIDFFRTDCKPCRKGLPKLVKLHRRYKNRGVKVLLVALLEEEKGEAKLGAFLRKNPLPFTVLIDSYGVAAKKYVLENGIVKIPALFVVDRHGKLRHVVRGLDDKGFKRLQKLVEKLAR